MDNIEIHGISRGAFLVRGALATGAAVGAASVTLGDPGARAGRRRGRRDPQLRPHARVPRGRLLPAGEQALAEGQYKSLAKDFGANEQEHVDALEATIKPLGGKPVTWPTFAFGLKSQKDFEKLAITLEDTGVSAYNGAAPMIESKDVLAAAGSIVQVEARHAAALRFLDGMSPTSGVR